jgi:hypothetical protein
MGAEEAVCNMTITEPVKAVIRESLGQIRYRYRAARRAAILAGPFGGLMWEAMRRLRSPSFLAYPRMLAHPKTIDAYNDPDGRGEWLQVFSEAEDRFRELEQWELYQVHRNERLSAICWWSAVGGVIVTSVALYCFGLETAGNVFLAVLSTMLAVSLCGALFGHTIEMRAVNNCRNGFETVARELPDRLWAAIDQGQTDAELL